MGVGTVTIKTSMSSRSCRIATKLKMPAPLRFSSLTSSVISLPFLNSSTRAVLISKPTVGLVFQTPQLTVNPHSPDQLRQFLFLLSSSFWLNLRGLKNFSALDKRPYHDLAPLPESAESPEPTSPFRASISCRNTSYSSSFRPKKAAARAAFSATPCGVNTYK